MMEYYTVQQIWTNLSFFGWHRLILTKVHSLNPYLVSVYLQHPQFFLVIPVFIFSVYIKTWTFWVYCRSKLVGFREILSSDSDSWMKNHYERVFTFHFSPTPKVVLAIPIFWELCRIWEDFLFNKLKSVYIYTSF